VKGKLEAWQAFTIVDVIMHNHTITNAGQTSSAIRRSIGRTTYDFFPLQEKTLLTKRISLAD
jgi:hypothetical protein